MTTSTGTSTEPPGTARRFGANHRWVVLTIGVAAQASFSAAISGLPVAGPSLRSDYGLSNTQLGVAVGAIYLGIALSEILWGIWTDRFGERRILLVGLVSTALMLSLIAVALVPTDSFVPSIGLLALSFLLVGVFGGSINGSSGRAVMTWFDEGQRGLAMSIRQTAMPAGGAIGIAVIPWLATSYGFRAVFITLAVLCFAAAAAAWRWLHEPPNAVRTTKGNPATGESPLRRWDIWRLALASALLTVPQFGILTFSAVFLHDEKNASVLTTVVALTLVQVGGGAARIWSGRFTDKRGNRRQMIKILGALAAVMVLAAALLVNGPTVAVVVALVLGGIFGNAWHGVAYTEIASMAGVSRAGAALGLENTTVFAMGFITPLLIPLLLGWSSWTVVWLVVAAASALAVPLSPRALQSVRKNKVGAQQ